MSALAGRLLAEGEAGLFLRGAGARLWAEPGAPQALAALAGDAEAPPVARFLAAELVAAGAGTPPHASLAAAYAAALAAAPLGNAWGLPGALDTPPARHLVAFGAAALPALRPLLGDARPLRYAGSEEATLGNAAAWRVKDMAASLVAAIEGQRFDAGAPPALRDAAIARLG